MRNAYDALCRSLDEAVLYELLPANPCAAVRAKLPSIEDKHPEARDTWFFSRAEVWLLMTDPRVPGDRRMAYAVEFLTGCRPGELAVLRWRDWDTSARPLTRLTLSRARKSVSKKEGSTKTGARKYAPVLPFLERLLTEWRTSGWRLMLGRDPGVDDLIVPNTVGNQRGINQANRDFARDLVKLNLARRHHYCTRHTFITQAQEDGADPPTLKWATHAPPKSAFDGYTRTQWTRLCAEVAKLQVEGEKSGDGGGGGGLTPGLTPDRASPDPRNGETPGNQAVSEGLLLSGREDLKRRGRVVWCRETL